MADFRGALLDVIGENEQLIAPFLVPGSKRTHAFLGSCQHIRQPVFSRHGGDGLEPCILKRVYGHLYPHMAHTAPSPNDVDELHPFFECSRIDCTYYSNLRKCGTTKFPIEWETDWIIEVENDLREFAFTLRCLLDFTATHRLGIFFSDRPDDDIGDLTAQFLAAWEPFASRFNFANDLHLQAVLLPNTYTSFAEYAASSRSFIWDARSKSFCKYESSQLSVC